MKIPNPLDLAKVALAPTAPDDQQRVVELFRNRAELKKAYVELQDEIHRLKDRLKQQEGATARVRELLEQLEARLCAPEAAYPTLVFYQLRSLWSRGGSLLKAFASDLERQYVEREKKLFLANFNRRQFAERRLVEARLREAELVATDAQRENERLQAQLARLKMPWHHFKRRRAEEGVASARLARAQAESHLHESRELLERLLPCADVPFPGLSVEARRAINIAVIAYAQVLAVRLTQTSLLELARAATLRRDAADDYGDRSECEALMADIGRAQGVLQQRTNLGQELQVRGESIRKVAAYIGDDDTVPTAESLLGAGGIDVLSSDTWDVFRALVR